MTVLFGFECPTVLFGAICGIFVFNVLLLAWRTTFVRNPRIINNGTTILVEQTRNADGWLARVRISRGNSTVTEEIEYDENSPMSDIATSTADDETSPMSDIATSTADDGINTTTTTTTNTAMSTTTSPAPGLAGDATTTAQDLPYEPEQRIIGAMDAAVPQQQINTVNTTSTTLNDEMSSTSTSAVAAAANVETHAIDVVDAQNCTNENSENSRDENNGDANDTVPAAAASVTHSVTNPEPSTAGAPIATVEPLPGSALVLEAEFTVKLKYLNDDMKIASGRPSERIGDFTKRNFAAELANNKSIRLIFNGQVLRPESKTLQACGMFADCVVHCLVRNTPPAAAAVPSTVPAQSAAALPAPQSTQPMSLQPGVGDGTGDAAPIALLQHAAHLPHGASMTTAGYRHPRQWRIDFGPGRQVTFITVFVLVTVALAWYVRIEHSHLFNAFSTIGLTLLSVMLVFTWYLLGRLEAQMTRRGAAATAAAGAAATATDIAGGGGGANGIGDVIDTDPNAQQQPQTADGNADSDGWGI